MPYRICHEVIPSEEIERRVKELDQSASMLIRAPPSANAPIFTPIFTAILGAGGFGLTDGTLSFGVGLASAISAGGGDWEIAA